ncbi:hypothetical protein HGM15179_015047, partial [Zosterops borbonicus]
LTGHNQHLGLPLWEMCRDCFSLSLTTHYYGAAQDMSKRLHSILDGSENPVTEARSLET